MLESKRRAIIFIVLSLLLAFAAGFLFLQKVQALNTELGEMAKIYVAGTDISSRSVIQSKQLKLIEIPKRYVSQSYITEESEIVNNVSVVPLSEGDIITKNMIKPVSNLRDENDRLVAVYASNRIHIDQRLEALDRVDLFVSQTLEGKPETKVFMKDVKVAGVSEDYNGLFLEIPFDEVSGLIYMQNYADSMRVIKANVGNPTPLNTTDNPPKEESKQPSKTDDTKSPEIE